MNVTFTTESDGRLREPRRQWSLFDWMALVICSLPLLYGLKCLLTQEGTMPFPRRWHYGFPVITVHGMAAVWTGLGWIGMGLFANLSVGPPPPEGRRWWWRLLRSCLRWGSLLGAFWCWNKGNELMNNPLWSQLPSWQEMTMFLPIAAILGIVGLQCFLFAMFRREAVKRELYENVCQPLHIQWRPAAYWSPSNWFSGATPFRVVYRDPSGFIHKAHCYVYRFVFGSAFGPRRVRWLTDEIADKDSSQEPFVWSDDEIVRRKLRDPEE